MAFNFDGGMAFPGVDVHMDRHTGDQYQFRAPGMSLRDYFAAAVLQGLASSYLRLLPPGPVTTAVIENTVETAYRHADAMLAKREKDIVEERTQRIREERGELNVPETERETEGGKR